MIKWNLYIVFLSILFPNVICTQDKIVSTYQDLNTRINELDTNLITNCPINKCQKTVFPVLAINHIELCDSLTSGSSLTVARGTSACKRAHQRTNRRPAQKFTYSLWKNNTFTWFPSHCASHRVISNQSCKFCLQREISS